MRKSFFLSILAVGALVAGCAKSEVVDTKFNEEIGFETYLGKAALTKGTIIESATFAEAHLFGYYTQNNQWNYDGTLTGENLLATAPSANLFDNKFVKGATAWGCVNEDGSALTRYWANDTDYYSFIAYAPLDLTVGNAAVAGPTISYTVSEDFTQHKDIVTAKDLNTTRATNSGVVNLAFKHALARLTVKATGDNTPFTFHVKDITLTGPFKYTGTYTISTNTWDSAVKAEGNPTYVFCDSDAPAALSSTDYKDVDSKGYMMMIPTDFTTTPATLNVVYYTQDPTGLKSRDYEKSFEIKTNFVAGKAYSINLAFANEENTDIRFNVTFEDWNETEEEVNLNGPDTPKNPTQAE